MKKSISLFIFIIFSGIILLSCSGREEMKQISGKWYLENVYDLNGDKVFPIHENDHLILNRDRTFYFYMGYEDSEESGSWDLIRKQLIFTFHMLPDEERYRKQYFDIEEQNENLLILYYDGYYYRYER